MYKLCFYVPVESAEKVKEAVFSAGAGRIGNYDSCCWQSEGVGQFRPLQGSNPAIGAQDNISYEPEVKVELVCESALVRAVVEAMIAAHPYEEPAYQLWSFLTLADLP
jgi:hypothetical protein